MFDAFKPQAKPKELRPHQVKALDMLRSSFGKGNKRTVMQAPTGFGKTVTASEIIQGATAKGKRVMFTVPRISLIDQAVTEFEGQGIDHIGVIQADHPRGDLTAPVQVASVDTLARRSIDWKPDLVIVDECHFTAKSIDKMMSDLDRVHFVGLSATPWAKGMGRFWQDLCIPVTICELIEMGFLSQFTAYAPDIPDMSGVKKTAGEYQEAGSADAMSDKKLIASILETWLDKGGNRPTLAFGVNCAHAQAMQAEFEAAGISTGYCDAFTDRVQMGRLERQFRAGEIKVVWSVRKLTTGVDWPVSCIIDAAPTASEMLHVQKIGRGLRVNEGSEDCLILDHAGNSLRLGLVTDIHHEKLDDSEKGEKQRKPVAEKLPKECANCGALHAGKVCPFCGHERKPQPDVDVEDGELVELTSKTKPPTKEEKQRWYSGLIWLGRQRGYKNGWAANKYRDKFGVWPRSLEVVPVAADAEIMNWVKSRAIAYAKKQEKIKAKR